MPRGKFHRPSVYERFMRRLIICEHGTRCEECCWLWIGAKSHGYGQIHYHGFDIGAHVFMWMWANRCEVPQGKFVCHSCDIPACCQPAHLWAGTPTENMQDAIIKGRWPFKYTMADIEQVYILNKQGLSNNAIEKEVGISSVYVGEILKRTLHSNPDKLGDSSFQRTASGTEKAR